VSEAERRAVVAAAKAASDGGLMPGTAGNVSARWGDGFLVTPSGVPYGRLTPDQIVPMRLDGSHEGPWKPSSEWRMHADIYRTRPEAGAVVHTHSPHATALSTHRRGIPAFHYMIALAGGPDIRCAEYATFGSAELSEAMLAALDGRKACLLANHGVTVFERDLQKALRLAFEVETLAQEYFLARQLGEPVILDDVEMARVIERFSTYGAQPSERQTTVPGRSPDKVRAKSRGR
jgi:L-fuculose-phosphate aldolase